MSPLPEEVMARIIRDHRHLDDLLGRCVSTITSEDLSGAALAIAAFDRELRRHTSLEDEHLFGHPAGGRLAPSPLESEEAILRRELAVEHVQVRELSGMLLRLLTERRDLPGARALLPNLLRRWDAHTGREESALLVLMPEGADLGPLLQPDGSPSS